MYNDTRTEETWDLYVKAATAESYDFLGKTEKALDTYRIILEHDENKPFFPTSVLLDAPFLIVKKGKIDDFQFAFDVLQRAEVSFSKQGLHFAVQRFVYYACHSLIRHRSGQIEEAKENAIAALQQAGVQHSGLRYHRRAGLVGTEHRATILTLRSISSGYPEWLLKLIAKVS